jgi:predicted permease
MRWFDRFKLRLRTLLRRGKVESELHRELEFHLEQQIAENVAKGMSLEQGRYAALRAIGGIGQIEERCRDQRGLHLIETTMQDVRYALRSLRKNPAFALVAVLSLALGTGANTAIFSLIDSLLLSSLPVKNPEQLVFVKTNSVRSGTFQVSRTMLNRDIKQMQRQATHFEGFASSQADERLSVGLEGHTELLAGEFVSGTYFQLLGVQAQAGRTILPEDDLQTGNSGGAGWPAMISDRYRRRHFGADGNVIGEKITINTIPFVVVGVIPQGFAGLSIDQQADVMAPAITYKQVSSGSPSAGFPAPENSPGDVLARLRSDASSQQAAAELTRILRTTELAQNSLANNDRQTINRQFIELEPAGHGSSFLRRRFSEPLRILMIVVAMVMILACANLAALLLAKASTRHKELAIRLSLGSSRARIIRQLFMENLILSVVGCLAGLLFAVLARDLTLKLGAGPDARHLAMPWDARLFLFLAAIAVANAFLFGIVPALGATRIDPNDTLKNVSSSQQSIRVPLGRVLIAAQLAISLALVINSGLFLATLQKLYDVDLGFDREKLLMASLDPRLLGIDNVRIRTIYQQLLQDMKALPSVSCASLMNNPLLTGRAHLLNVKVPGYVAQAGEELSNSWTLTYDVGSQFLQTVGMPLTTGRDFNDRDNEHGSPVVIVNEAMARHYFGKENPLGKKIMLSSIFKTNDGSENNAAEIIGVVRNAHYFDVRDEQQEAVFVPLLQLQQFSTRQTLLVRTREEPTRVAGDLRAVVRRIDPNLPLFDITTMPEQLDNSLRQPRLLATFSAFFGGLALLLSAVGLYGLLAYGVTKRTSEIGIRMALGADRRSILSLILGETGQVLLIGIGAGLVLAGATSRLVKSMLYGLGVHDPRVYTLAALLLAAIALAAAMLPARRAVNVDPMVALRYE